MCGYEHVKADPRKWNAMTAAERAAIEQGLTAKLNFLRHSLAGALDGLTLLTELLESEQICQVRRNKITLSMYLNSPYGL